MTSTICDEAVLEADRVGRVRVGEERRLALLAEFDRSHLSAQAFAELVGVRYSTFAGWIQRRRASRGVKTSSAWSGAPIKLVEAVLDSCVQHPLPALL
jgi:transposase